MCWRPFRTLKRSGHHLEAGSSLQSKLSQFQWDISRPATMMYRICLLAGGFLRLEQLLSCLVHHVGNQRKNVARRTYCLGSPHFHTWSFVECTVFRVVQREFQERPRIWLWVKNRYPKCPGKWKHGSRLAVPWWFSFDLYPFLGVAPTLGHRPLNSRTSTPVPWSCSSCPARGNP